MKKLFDSKFLFIVALSLVVLIILGIGAFYLFDDKDDTFVKNGYVINPLSGKVEKYLFNENTPYKENLSSMIVFKDVDNKNASILKDSFLHYNDGSLSFLTNGAILDLDTINGSETVNYYNITNASIIEKKGDKYVIKNSGNDINLKNFIGRISEDKFIVVGKLEAQIPGNEKNISADYFEIVYSEKGVVNIENKDNKFQVTAEGTIIHIGNIAIDLGAKKISRNGEDVMSLTAITINGDENIEIIPETEKEEEEGNGSEDGTNATDNAQNGNGADDEGSGSGQGGNGGEGGTGEGGTGKENTEIDTTQDIIVSLKKASIGSTSVDVTFDMYNTIADDNFSLKVTNLESGRTVDLIETISANEEIRINLLSPNTKYLFTVTNDRDGNKYFQKIFQTNDFGIKLEKTYATDSELGFKVIVDKDTDISNAKLALYKYNEITKQNEIVTTSYYDNVANETKYSEKVTYLSSITGNIEGVHEIVYDGLDSNTIYTAVLDEFSLVSVNFKDVYNITETVMTLKKTPEFSDMTVSKDVGAGTFKLSLKDIVDKDNAIESYTYRIYEVNNPDQTVISPITKTNASPIEIKIGDKENQLKNDTNYFYKVIIEYFDNEKYVEYILDDTINFVMGSDPYITVVPNDEKISYDKIGATIYLTDNSCLIAMPGREKCIGPSSTRINVYDGKTLEYTRIVDFDVNDDEIKYEFELDGLQAGTRYAIEVEAIRSDELDLGSQVLLTTEESRNIITTKTLTNFHTEWIDKGSNDPHVVNLQTKFAADEATGTLGPDESAATIKKVVAKLYNGSCVEDYINQEPIATRTFVNSDEFNIKDNFYDHGYSITTDETFGLDIEGLEAKNNGELSEYYTVAIFAYYDNAGTNQVILTSNVTSYKISPLLLIKNVEEPEIYAAPRSKTVAGVQNNLINSGTTVSYMVTGRWDASGLVQNGLVPTHINLYVYNDQGEKVKFYIKNGDNFVLVNGIENESIDSTTSFYEKEIFMDYGSPYGTQDEIMSRGNNYYIGYQLVVTSSSGSLLYPNNTNQVVHSDYGKFTDVIKTEKETPTGTMYIAKSTANSIKYKYTLKDPDNALYKENDSDTFGYYYTINDGEEVKINLTKDTSISEFNAFSGEFTISGLNNGDVYSLYYKKNSTKTGNFESDVLNYFDGADAGKRVFDGFYDLTETKYNFKYKIINPESDNKVTIKILANEEILDRIVNYEITFTDSVNPVDNVLVENLWKLGACPGDAEDAKPKCFSVDYVKLKNKGMKSTANQTHIISVKVVAFYDNGLTGYDYTVGNDGDYNYMIFQNNLVPNEEAKYVSFTKADTIAVWSPDNDIAKGYYTYKKVGRGFDYTNILRRKTKSMNYALTGSGYSSNYGILNPKMVSADTMTTDNNKFSFNSITPKIKVEKTTSLINGAAINLSLSGADLEDFCEEGDESGACTNNANSEFYLYIDVWNASIYAQNNDMYYTLRPKAKVKINKNNPSESVRIMVDGLSANGLYFYNVYAYLNKNGHPKYTQLFDYSFENEYKVKIYNFMSLSSSDLYHSYAVSFRPNLEQGSGYSDKLMDTTINLVSYANNIPFNFDLGYAFCHNDDYTCGISENSTSIFKNVIDGSKVKAVTTDTFDISDETISSEIEFGTDYFMRIVAVYDQYERDPDTRQYVLKKTNLPLNGSQLRVSLRKLLMPKFVVEREAVYIPGENGAPGKYAIDFTINVDDPDRVLDDGKYYVALKDNNGNIVGDLQVLDDGNYSTVAIADECGSYVPVSSSGECQKYSFDALVSEKQVRITGLTADTRYTIEVYNKAYVNNYNENIPVSERYFDAGESFPVYSTNDAGVAFGKELIYSATAKTFVVTFMGGSNFDNVREVGYTVARWGQDASGDFTYSGCYNIGDSTNNPECQNNKHFEQFEDTGYWKFVIDDERINNQLGETYYIALSFAVVNADNDYIHYYGDDESHPITNNPITNPEFFGRAQYVKENTQP